MRKIGRNELCHCGSGKKYKNCHQQVDGRIETQNKRFIIGGALALVIIIISIVIYFNQPSSSTKAPTNAPPGKVWSEEHGHWHDA
jgi:hypothetical protein